MINRYIIGAGGHGKVVFDAMQKSGLECTSFLDDKDIYTWLGIPVEKLHNLTITKESEFHIAIGNNQIRSKIFHQFRDSTFYNVIHPASTISNTSIINAGTFVAANAVIGPYSQVGSHCIINHSAVVDHDCLIGDFAHIAPGAILGGGAKIGVGCLIGAGAVILPEISISESVIVGAGAVVTRDVAAGTVVGIPAKNVR